MTVKTASLELDDAFRLAADIFAPLFLVSVQEFYEMLVKLDQMGFISADLKYKLQPLPVGGQAVPF